MKIQATLFSILTTGLLTASSGAQTVGVPDPSGKLTFITKRPATVRLVSLETANGKQIIALSAAKAGAVQKRLALAGSSIGSALSNAKGSKFPAIVIGPTGGAAPLAATTVDTVIVRARTNGRAVPFSANPLAATIERQVFRGDLPRDTTLVREGLTPGGAATTVSIAIGPNGFPVFPDTAAPQSGTNPIGPNGFPELTTTGPRSGIQPIGPNGFPATNVAPFAQTGVMRAGTPRDTTLPAASTLAASVSGISSAASGLPALTLAAPASGGSGTAAPAASPR